jgi:hypothetical protein
LKKTSLSRLRFFLVRNTNPSIVFKCLKDVEKALNFLARNIKPVRPMRVEGT